MFRPRHYHSRPLQPSHPRQTYPMKVFVTGGTGLIGRRLLPALLARGDSVVSLSRKPAEARPGFEPVVGDPVTPGEWLGELADCDAVVHLAGEPVAGKRWTAEVLGRI